jgi:uncharacterized membrane protein
VAWRGGAPLTCSPGSGCEVVQSSRFASVLGLPIATWGALAYAALAAVAWSVRSVRWHAALALALSGPALAVSLYLTGISLTVLQTTCAWCMASLGLVLACFIASLRALTPHLFARPAVWTATAVVSLLAVGALHLQFRNELALGPEDPRMRALARHLAESGAVFYGASWCDHCAEQKVLFGGAAHRLPYVECSPDGRGTAQAPSCRNAGVEAYPTWIIGGQHFEGLLPVERLARLSGFAAAGS